MILYMLTLKHLHRSTDGFLKFSLYSPFSFYCFVWYWYLLHVSSLSNKRFRCRCRCRRRRTLSLLYIEPNRNRKKNYINISIKHDSSAFSTHTHRERMRKTGRNIHDEFMLFHSLTLPFVLCTLCLVFKHIQCIHATAINVQIFFFFFILYILYRGILFLKLFASKWQRKN